MKYRFGRFVIDGDTRQLLSGGDEIHLSPKAFELLTILVANRPKAVSKQELLNRMWPSTFVEETNLAGLVAEIRRALDDSATAPVFVRTVHRFGYAFQGSVTEVAHNATPAAPRPEVVYWLVSPSRQIRLVPGENVVGRDPETSIWFDLPGISRYHARIIIEGDRVIVEDLGSKNGTRVRGDLITARTNLADGDEIRFGSMNLTFRVWTSAGSTASES